MWSEKFKLRIAARQLLRQVSHGVHPCIATRGQKNLSCGLPLGNFCTRCCMANFPTTQRMARKIKVADCRWATFEPGLAWRTSLHPLHRNTWSEMQRLFRTAVLRIRIRNRMFLGLPDPHPDPYFSHKYGSGSGSGSLYHQAKIVRKILKTTVPVFRYMDPYVFGPPGSESRSVYQK